jgi:hypothetical protein
MVTIEAAIIGLVIRILIISPVLWIAGRALVGGDKARFTDAIWIVILGTVIGGIIDYIFQPSIISAIVVLIIWVGLVKHFFDCGWLKTLAIGIIAILIFIAIAIVLGLIGFAIWSFLPTPPV